MSSNVIPIGIFVNPIPYTLMRVFAPDNAVMDYKTEGQAIVSLAREKHLDVFDANGEVNETKLAKVLSAAARSKIHQSTLTRLMAGKLSGKTATLQRFADGFGITLVEFISRIRPATAAPTTNTSALPREAAELWQLWKRVPARQRDLFLEQIKAAAEFSERYPDLVAVVNEPATQAATEIRLARQRLKKSG